MSESVPERAETQDLNVAADESSIYQGGNLTRVSVEDLLDNEVAVRQLLNTLNLAQRDHERSRAEIEALKMERMGYLLQPWILLVVAIINLSGVAIMGIGTNLLTNSPSPPVSGWIFGIGLGISILTALCPVFLPLLIKRVSEKQHATSKR